jgi:hypothetical protein
VAKDCPSAVQLRQRVTERLGADPFVDDDAPHHTMQVSFTRESTSYRAKLVWRDAASEAARERQFTDSSEDCRQLADAVVLGIALLLEDDAAGTPASATEASGVEPTSAAPAEPTASTNVPAPLPTPKQEPQISPQPASEHPHVPSEIWAGPLLSGGAVSSDGFGYGIGVLGVILPMQPFGFAWGTHYQSGNTIQRGQTRYVFSETAALLGPVTVVRVSSRVSCLLGLGFLVGVTHAAVVTRNPTDPGDFFFAGARFAAAARVRLIGPLALSVGGQLRTLFNRSVFRAQGLAEPVWKQPRLSALGEIGLGLQFD